MERHLVLPACALLITLSCTALLLAQGMNRAVNQEAVDVRQDMNIGELGRRADANERQLAELVKQSYEIRAGLEQIRNISAGAGVVLSLLLSLDMWLRSRKPRGPGL